MLAVTRIALGFIFLWAFLDKTFGLGYSTSAAKAWVNGGSPTSGFLGHVEVGPFRTAFVSLAGSPVVDALFMLGMLGVGLALILGVGLRIAAVSATVILLGMWAAEWPLAQLTFEGQPSGSVNPIVDYHIIYALVAIVAALTYAGRVWGLGTRWESTSLVKRLPWLK
jgi:thiosulfate dehydrogenase [quinone] large subunit